MCLGKIQAQELVLGSRGSLHCKMGLSNTYKLVMGQHQQHLILRRIMFFLAMVQIVKEKTISTPENMICSISINKLQPLSQSETAFSEEMCPLPLPVPLLLPPLTPGLTSAEGIGLCQNRACIKIIQIWSLSSPGRRK